MKPSQDAGERWKRVCELASLLLDSPEAEWDAILDRECGTAGKLRARVLETCANYSEADDFFGEPIGSRLRVEDVIQIFLAAQAGSV